MTKQIIFQNVSFNNGVVNFKKINLEISSGELLVISGPSGSGKSILVHLITNRLCPSHGKILKSVNNIKVVNSYSTIFEHLSLLENVLIPVQFTTKNYQSAIPKCIELMEWLGIANHNLLAKSANNTEKYLSMLAQNLINNPEVLILDNPFMHIDEKLLEHFISIISKLNHSKMTIIITAYSSKLLQNGLNEFQEYQLEQSNTIVRNSLNEIRKNIND